MNSILAIVFLCGVGVACSQSESKSQESGSGIFAPFVGSYNPVSEPVPVAESFVHVTQVDTSHKIESNELYGQNGRLVALLTSMQRHLAFGENDAAAKKPFSLVTLFFLHYFDMEGNNLESDLIKAFKMTFEVTHKPANVIAAPIHTMMAKFISAVANRIGYVYDLCKDKPDCISDVSERDSNEKSQCSTYSENVDLHNLALQKIESEEAVLQFILDVSLQGVDKKIHSRPFDFEEFKEDLLDMKILYKTLKSHNYTCYNV